MWKAIRLLFYNASTIVRRRTARATRLSPDGDGVASTAQVSVVAVLVDDHDRRLLANLGSDNGWVMHFVDSCAEAKASSAQLGVPVILCDSDLPGTDWRDTVYVLASSARPACVILISRIVDDYLWVEVIRHGGFEVLSKPLRQEEIVRVIRLACSFRKAS
jgi:two-component system, NtrC family, response regulator HydG